ncbi:alpha/beta hydrolase [Hyphobacterium sp. CCMP332]|nr:alpha/beta hydrolase [Hyphobacterium sp. CCMP332]
MRQSPDLSYKSFGEGSKHVIFLHGYCEVKEMWDDFISHFKDIFQFYKFISIDLPGFGKSQMPESLNTLSDSAEMVAEHVRSLGIDKSIWIGHSLGGYVILNLLRKYDEMLEGICLFHSSIYADSPEKKKQRNKTSNFIRENGKKAFLLNFIPNLFFEKNKISCDKEIHRSIKQGMQNSEESMIKYMEMMRERLDKSNELAASKIPVHFICGKNDSSVPLSISQKQIRHIPTSSSTLLDECGHMGMFENPIESSASIKSFLSNF